MFLRTEITSSVSSMKHPIGTSISSSAGLLKNPTFLVIDLLLVSLLTSSSNAATSVGSRCNFVDSEPPCGVPQSHFRNWGGGAYKDERYYQLSAVADAASFMTYGGITKKSRVLEIGTAVGRIALGFLYILDDINKYVGIDVMKECIDWTQQNISPFAPNFEFQWVNKLSPRYNTQGAPPPGICYSLMNEDGTIVKEEQCSEAADKLLEFEDNSFDTVIAFSVLSHFDPFETKAYFKDILRVVEGTSGKALLTAYVEGNVEPFTENPADYLPVKGVDRWKGRLHCARYSVDYLAQLAQQAGWTWMEVVPQLYPAVGQSLVILTAGGDAPSAAARNLQSAVLTDSLD